MTKTLLLLACLAGCSNWRVRDTVLETTLIGLTVVDWHQTRDITKNCSEINPVIGECGQRMNMHVYFASVLALEVIVARLISPNWRSVLHGAWIGAEGATVWDNTQE